MDRLHAEDVQFLPDEPAVNDAPRTGEVIAEGTTDIDGNSVAVAQAKLNKAEPQEGHTVRDFRPDDHNNAPVVDEIDAGQEGGHDENIGSATAIKQTDSSSTVLDECGSGGSQPVSRSPAFQQTIPDVGPVELDEVGKQDIVAVPEAGAPVSATGIHDKGQIRHDKDATADTPDEVSARKIEDFRTQFEAARPAIRDMLGLEEGEPDTFFVGLFGSCAANEATEDSDVDGYLFFQTSEKTPENPTLSYDIIHTFDNRAVYILGYPEGHTPPEPDALGDIAARNVNSLVTDIRQNHNLDGRSIRSMAILMSPTTIGDEAAVEAARSSVKEALMQRTGIQYDPDRYGEHKQYIYGDFEDEYGDGAVTWEQVSQKHRQLFGSRLDQLAEEPRMRQEDIPEEVEPLDPAHVAEKSIELESEFATAIQNLYNGPDSEFEGVDYDKHPVFTVVGELEAELGEANDGNVADIFLGVRNRLAETRPEIYESVSPYLDEVIKVDNQIRVLKSRYGDMMASHRDQEFERLAANVDWDKVIESFMGESWPDGASITKNEVFEQMFDIAHSHRSDRLDSMYYDAQCAQILQEFATSIGAVLDEPTPKPKDGWYSHEDVVRFVQDWEESTDKALSYMNSRRGRAVKMDLHQVKSYQIKSLARRLHADGNKDTFVLAPVADALKRCAAKAFDDFDKHAEGINHIDTQSLPNATLINISPQLRSKLEHNAGITNIAAWFNERLDRFGPRLGSGIGFVEFTDNDRPNSGDDDAVIDLGEHKPTENKLLIDVRSGKFQAVVESIVNIYEDEDDPIKTASFARFAVRHKIERTTDHEIAHHIHGAVLTLPELRQWQKALDAEPDPSIDDYMKDLVAAGAPEKRIRVEQFTIRTSMYMNDPLEVALNYPLCFAVLNSIIGKFDSAKIEQYIAPLRELRASGENSEADRQLAVRKLATGYFG